MSLSEIEADMHEHDFARSLIAKRWHRMPGRAWKPFDHKSGTVASRTIFKWVHGELHIWAYTDMPGQFNVVRRVSNKYVRIASAVSVLDVLCHIKEFGGGLEPVTSAERSSEPL